MREEEFEKLVEKYKEGNSSLKEENVLFNHSGHSEPSLEAWSTFVKNNKAEAPKGLNDTLWASFQHNKAKKRRLLFRTLALAASVILLGAFFITNQEPKEQSYAEKERLLKQALEMFDNVEQEEVHHHVFYENELVVLYTTTE